MLKNIFLVEIQNGIDDVYNVTRAMRIISHDVYIRPVRLNELMHNFPKRSDTL